MTWIRDAAEATSYRRMYLLAIEIAGSELAASDVRRASRRVMRSLENIIELPIADAVLLAKARRRFVELQAALDLICSLPMSA